MMRVFNGRVYALLRSVKVRFSSQLMMFGSGLRAKDALVAVVTSEAWAEETSTRRMNPEKRAAAAKVCLSIGR